ncbi:MAG: saccharopine dehydrogenase C-terminal domain-containing protein [Planctomycetota bacterium]
MKTLVVLGAGKIGRMVTHFLATCGDYQVRVGDVHGPSAEAAAEGLENAEGKAIDFTSQADLDAILDGASGVLSCAPYHCNPLIAERAKAKGAHYFDLTEDVAVTRKVKELADGAKSAFMPQCGLAPGFITIVGHHLIEDMSEVHDLRLRVGALPKSPRNRMAYNLSWSTEGLINEYCNPCEVVRNGELIEVPPLEDVERILIEGIEYEAFHTSGGLGTLADSLRGKVRNLDYKTMRYPGHVELLRFLLHDLQFEHHRDDLRAIFERSLPLTEQDRIAIYTSAIGIVDGQLTERVDARCVDHKEIDGKNWTGIQITTAAGICAVVDLMMQGQLPTEGFVRQEQVAYPQFLANRFGRYYG